MIAENEFEISKVISLLSDEDKIRRISKLYSIDEILEVLGYYDYSMDADDIKLIDSIKEKLKNYRKSGLEKEGELSYENLVFKFLRRSGHIEKLFDISNKAVDKELSVERKLED